MAFLQMIIRDCRAEVMDVMKTDVARKPLQNFRQLIERTSLERRSAVIPIRTAFPMNIFELVLNVKQPHSRRAGNSDDNDVKCKISFPPQREAETDSDEKYCKVRQATERFSRGPELAPTRRCLNKK